MAVKKPARPVKKVAKPKANSVAALKKALTTETDAYCKAFLNKEYRDVCRVMVKGLCIADSPAFDGSPKSWAAAVVGAVGYVNGLHDAKLKMKPYLSKAALQTKLKVNAKLYAAQVKLLIKGFGLMKFDPDFLIPSLLPVSPLMLAAASPTMLEGCCGGGTCCAEEGCCNVGECTREDCCQKGSS
jgi:hypothetical protein